MINTLFLTLSNTVQQARSQHIHEVENNIEQIKGEIVSCDFIFKFMKTARAAKRTHLCLDFVGNLLYFSFVHFKLAKCMLHLTAYRVIPKRRKALESRI